jgi:CubicO group peptidase (beta-lactamase class C family)
MKQFPWCLLALLSLPAPADAQTDSVDAFVRDFIRRHDIPAAAVSVVHRGKVMKAAGYGVANLELGVAATGRSVFEIGSERHPAPAPAHPHFRAPRLGR